MKKILSLFISSLVVSLFLSGVAMAQEDTLLVYATPYNLEEIINNDTTSAGLQAHKVYKLVSLDTTYVFQDAITVKSDIKVIGALGEDGRPPCIQPMTLSDNSLPNYLFVMNGNDTKAEFKNLYLTGLSTDNTINSTFYNGEGALINLTGDRVRLSVDNVVFSDWPTHNVAYTGDSCSIFISNCVFRNSNVSTAWYSGEAVRNTYNTASSDTLSMINNTIYCLAYSACTPVTISPVNYFEFSHNNVMYMFKNPFWIYNLTNGKMNNNLFYAAFAGASDSTEHFNMWDQLRSFARTGIADFDTLNTAMAEWLAPEAAGTDNLMWTAEAKRTIEVRNNVCYWPDVITDFWDEWNDTHDVADTIITPVWMNERTEGMFANDTQWPGLVASGNMDVDPQFGSSIDDVVYDNTGCGDGFYDHFTAIRENDATSVTRYGYKLESVEGDNWIPDWPLPETDDMQYTNTSLKTAGTDGLPIGDVNWFDIPTGVEDEEGTLPSSFTLYNAYPNPFNPSTMIKFDLVESGNVELRVYNILGQQVQTIINNEFKTAGSYQYQLKMDNFASGVYMVTLSQNSKVSTKKIVLMK